MMRYLFSILIVLGVAGLGFAQKVDSTVVKTQKKIIIKTMDDEGNVETRIFEGDDEETDSKLPLWITKGKDSIIVEVFADSIMIDDFEPFDEDDFKKFEWTFKEDKDFPGKGRRMMILGDDMKGFAPFAGEDKGKLGVMIEESPKGVKITEVEEFSAAYSVGMLAGDVITEVNGIKMTNVQELQREIGSKKPGDMVEVEVKRNGKNKEFEVRLDRQDHLIDPMKFLHDKGHFSFPGRFGHPGQPEFEKAPHGPNGMPSHDCGKGRHDDHKCCDKHESKKRCDDKGHKEEGCLKKEKN